MSLRDNTKRVLSSPLIKSFSVYTIAQVLNSAIPFFLLPIMTSYLTPKDYGIISMITTVCAFMIPLVTLKLDTAVVRRYYYKDDDIAKYIGNCLIILIALFSLVSFILLFSGTFVSIHTGIPCYVLMFIPLYCVFSFLKNIVLYYWQVNNKPVYYGSLSIISTAIELSIAILLIVCFDFNWIGRAIGIFVTYLLVAVFSIVFLFSKHMIKIVPDKGMISHALKFGSGLVPAAIGSSIMTLSDRFFLTNMISIDETGLYSVACSFASLLSFVTVSFCNAFVPWMFENLSKQDDEANRKVVSVSYLYFGGLIILSVLFYFIIKWIFPFFVSNSFDGSMKFIPWLLCGNVFYGFYLLMTNFIIYSEKTFYSTIITFSCGLLGAVLNYVFISLLGAVGAAIATTLSFLVFFLLTWFISNRVYPMPWVKCIK